MYKQFFLLWKWKGEIERDTNKILKNNKFKQDVSKYNSIYLSRE